MEQFPTLQLAEPPLNASKSTVESNGERPSSKQRRPSYISPPYWRHNRSASYATQRSLETPPAITLADNTGTCSADANGGLWAKSVCIDSYVVVRGNSATGLGAYVVYNVRVQTLDGGPLTIRKRYSEFDELRTKLLAAFPQSTNSSLPPIPAKSIIYKFRPKFLEKRCDGLNYFLNCVMLNPGYAGSAIVKDFIFAHES